MNDFNSLNRKNVEILSKYSDEELLIEYKTKNDPDSLSLLIQRYEKELLRYLTRFLGDRETAEDVFQQTFLQIVLKARQFKDDKKARFWIFRIAINQAIDFKRKTRRRPTLSLDCPLSTNNGDVSNEGTFVETLVDRFPEPSEIAVRRENGVRVRQAVARLPLHLKETIDLVYFQGLKYQEAAVRLGIPCGTVKNRIFVAVQRLNYFVRNSSSSKERSRNVRVLVE